MREVAAAIPIAPRKLRRLEAGRLDPDYELLLGLCRALRLKPAEFVERVLQFEEVNAGE